VINVVTPYSRQAASSRVRIYEWLDRTREPFALSDYVSHRNASPSYLLRHPRAVLAAERRLRRMASGRLDRLILHREASPLSRGGLEARLLAHAGAGLYDFDDALQWDTGAGGVLRRVAPKAPKALAAVRNADRVIAGNQVLADWASQHNRDVVVIPSCVSPENYRQKRQYTLGDPPRLGWIGSADNEVYVKQIAGALHEIHRRTGARITLVSSTKPSLGDLEPFVDRIAWSEDSQEVALATFDVGIAPLPDQPYTRGKCGYKLLQYAAVGLPVVASPIGVNQQILSRLGAPAATSNGEWVEAVLELLTRSDVTRAELGGRARAVVEEHYSYDAWQSRWEHAVGIGSIRT
jgi:glycosyltransferase involved in cell wall biosynthesis